MSSIHIELDEEFDKGFFSENLFDSVDSKIIKELLICPLFPHILKDPIKCPDCEAHFCTKCLKTSLEFNNKCPLCRSEIILNQKENEPSKILISILDNLKVTCENSAKGCPEKFLFKDKESFTEHLEEKCGYVDVTCTNYNCGKNFLKKDLDVHIRQCELDQLECEYCRQKFARNSMENHVKENICSDICKWCTKRYSFSEEPNHCNECDLMWIVCLHCQKTLYKKDFAIHREQNCVKTVIFINPQTFKSSENNLYIRRGNSEQVSMTPHRMIMNRRNMNPISNSCMTLTLDNSMGAGNMNYMMLNNRRNNPNPYTYTFQY